MSTSSSISTPPPQLTGTAKEQKSAAKHRGTSNQGTEDTSRQSPPTPTTPPISSAPIEGSTTPAPGVKTVKGGDNSVQTYGAESGESARTEAATTLQAYLNARLAEDWQTACSYLAHKIRAELEKLAEQVRSQGKDISGCAGAMEALTEGTPQSKLRQEATIEKVLSFRLGGELGELGFLLFVGPPEATLYSVPMSPEGGGWKVATVIPHELPV